MVSRSPANRLSRSSTSRTALESIAFLSGAKPILNFTFPVHVRVDAQGPGDGAFQADVEVKGGRSAVAVDNHRRTLQHFGGFDEVLSGNPLDTADTETSAARATSWMVARRPGALSAGSTRPTWLLFGSFSTGMATATSVPVSRTFYTHGRDIS